MTYEVRFAIEGKRKIQEYRIYTTQAASFAEALSHFLEWANDGEQKFDWRRRPFQFRSYPVTEENAVSIVRID